MSLFSDELPVGDHLGSVMSGGDLGDSDAVSVRLPVGVSSEGGESRGEDSTAGVVRLRPRAGRLGEDMAAVGVGTSSVGEGDGACTCRLGTAKGEGTRPVMVVGDTGYSTGNGGENSMSVDCMVASGSGRGENRGE